MWQTFGHEKAIRTLSRSIEADRIAHSYLITGPAKVGKTTLALDIARAANCSSGGTPCATCRQCQRITSALHPDVRIIGLEAARSGRLRTQISIEQVREIQRDASLLPYEGRNRVFIFESAEKLSGEAANSLLKTLEEPPENVIIILVASDLNAVLPTLVSRCRSIALRPAPLSAVSEFLVGHKDVNRERAGEIAGLSGGRIGWAIEAAESPRIIDEIWETMDSIEGTVNGSLSDRFDYAERLSGRFSADRQGVLEELNLWQSWWRDALLIAQSKNELVVNKSRMESLLSISERISAESVVSSLKAIRRTAFLLERNVSPRLAVEGMMMQLPSMPEHRPEG
ncbi:MAG: DNA polymerase III subunit [Dehalococcoidia bacterium]|nr:DNA polymerase III subunit [Dehalococcoidia bacterium]